MHCGMCCRSLLAAAGATWVLGSEEQSLLREPDSRHDDVELTRIAFGSCSKQWLAQPVWPSVTALRPQLWLWTGDAVYVDGENREGEERGSAQTSARLESAYHRQLGRTDYQEFLQNLQRNGALVEGVFDDHDFGLNDAGRELETRNQSQALFLDFLGVTDPRRRHRQGVFSSHTFGVPPRQVKVILLDTRFHRDQHYLKSLGSVAGGRLPFSALLAAMSRLLVAKSQIARDYDGDMLGEEQWRWLASQVQGSAAAVHIIVSSVQVFTSNPLLESWGHFPRARQRLAELLSLARPAGLLFVSGDVHFGEFISFAPPGTVSDAESPLVVACSADATLDASCSAENGQDDASRPRLLEVTSSGLTHGCSGAWWGALCKPILESYKSHRARGVDGSRSKAYVTEQNFGTIHLDWGESNSSFTTPVMNVELRDVMHGKPLASWLHNRHDARSRNDALDALSWTLQSVAF